jgi:hypothetical protein
MRAKLKVKWFGARCGVQTDDEQVLKSDSFNIACGEIVSARGGIVWTQ